jgi:hypothetical protein
VLVSESTPIYLLSLSYNIQNADKAMITSSQLNEFYKQLRQRLLSSQDGSHKSRQKSKPDLQLKEGHNVIMASHSR